MVSQPIANATNAGNAGTVGGLEPSGLVRVAKAPPRPIPAFGTSTEYTTIASVAIAAPGSGFVLLDGQSGFGLNDIVNGTSVRVKFRLRENVAASGTDSLSTVLSTPGPYIVTGGATTVLAVAGAGPRTYVLEARVTSGTINVSALNSQLIALFVPFGYNGGTTLAP